MRYKVIYVGKELEDDLNELAKEGWRVHCPCGKKNDILILKRKVVKEE